MPGLHSADTRRVFDELLGTAEHSIWASTYAFFDGRRAFEVLARRMDDCVDRNLEVGVLLRDRFFSRSLVLHFRRLIEERRLERL